MQWLTAVNSRLSRWAMYVACTCVMGLVINVDYGVIMRYGFNDAPPFMEQVALLLSIVVAMFGAAAGVRDAGHIGVDSLVALLPKRFQFWVGVLAGILTGFFAVLLVIGCGIMVTETYEHTIPTLNILEHPVSEAWRYLPPIIAGILITSFSIEHLIAMFKNEKVVSSWH
jgi:TRAP-type C4-dicarboxylate transport system permease small subunit